jgi:hypothetical protein
MEKLAGFSADALNVNLGCGCEGVVPVERREIVCGAGSIGELEESLLGRGRQSLGVEGRRRECESK